MGETVNSVSPIVLAALGNELVLEKIFQCLPLHSLLSCSEVCKAWNRQARTYIRDHRKCTISIVSPCTCHCLNALDEAVENMTVVAFNSLIFDLKPHENFLGHQNVDHSPEQPQDETSDGRFSCANLFARIKLKYLSISSQGELPKCPATFTMFRLLLEKGNEIKELHFGRISVSLAQHFQETHVLDMPKLERVEISWLENYWSKDTVAKILRGRTPKLKQILTNGSNKIFEILPDSKLRFLNNFFFVQFDGASAKVMDYARKLAKSWPTLSELNVFIIYGHDHQIPLQCLQIVQSLLQISFKSLRTLCLFPICLLKSMSFPPLENLISLRIKACWDPEEMRDSLQFFQFGRLFPKLQNVELLGEGKYQDSPQPLFSNTEEVLRDDDWDPQNASKTTSVLFVNGSVRSLTFLQLRKSFPAVVDLSIKAPMYDGHLVPYSLVFRLWPNLRTLVVTGSTFDQLPNCDAEFCGINQAEVELLWSMDEEYLRNVHIVPVRPCVTTMLSLNQISINLRLHYRPNLSGIRPGSEFLSPVTKFLVFQRMPWLAHQLEIKRHNFHLSYSSMAG